MWYALLGEGVDVGGMLLFEISFVSNQLFFTKMLCLLCLNPYHAPACHGQWDISETFLIGTTHWINVCP